MKNLEIKKQIRNTFSESRNSYPSVSRKKAEKAIESYVYSCPDFLKAEELYCYVSFGTEVCTHRIIQHALENEKKVAVPKVSGPHKMDFYYIRSLDMLKPGFKGILEPEEKAPLANGEKGLLFVPGLAFDPQGNRLGYGGGFYDAYISTHPKLVCCGLFYSIQQAEKLPVEAQDKQLQMIITEKGCLPCCQNCQMTL
ncbi:5-formyltetrahydrofolate cyclo-ligase [Faecalicatena acetigenes]|uniref:5-formyltetrahydrofolate cyclo-ligase n=1 Tax=Faecalicatena acetigenes TaxID=2981790 RepID=A0ABT2T913_9FIRM|nr:MULTISPECIES: 5-formyltetrahydrofolate cyclo-ligase [Lachnospiraceae]MCU6746716.1 5-formyltetrahydrofolate cyclo-ligase [Faecalicatena acetigenes]